MSDSFNDAMESLTPKEHDKILDAIKAGLKSEGHRERRGRTNMGIIDLIKEAGEENVMVQNILQSSPNINRGKKDGTILFHTDGQKVQALMGEAVGQERQWIAMLVWIPAKRKEKCTYTPESMYDPQYPTDPIDYSPPDPITPPTSA